MGFNCVVRFMPTGDRGDDHRCDRRGGGGRTSQLICGGCLTVRFLAFHELDQPTVRLSYRRVGVPKAGATCLRGEFIELSGFL
jgi:hypothetical protein